MQEKNESLEEQFAQIREVSGDFDRSMLPDQVELPLSEQFAAKELLELATLLWQRIYDQSEFLAILSRYVNFTKEQRDESKKEKQYFKKLRKAGLIYKSAFRFGDQRRDLPEDMDNFLVKLGELGDYFYHPEGRQIAQQILNKFGEKNFTQPVEQLTHTSLEEVEVRIKWIITKCQRFLSDSRLEVADFHKMRKLLRHIMNLYQIAAVARQDDFNIRQTFQYVCDLNSLLGDEHDEVVKKDIAGTAKYEEESIILDEYKIQKVQALLEKLQQALQNK